MFREFCLRPAATLIPITCVFPSATARGGGCSLVGLSDSGPFLAARIPVIDFHSLTQETFHILHTSEDAFPTLKMKAYLDSCNLLMAYLAYLDATLGASPQPPPQ